jgi:hypothetical protein
MLYFSWIERAPAPAVTNDPRPRANISVEPKSGLDPLIEKFTRDRALSRAL